MALPGNTAFDALLSTTIANYRETLVDNLSNSFFLFWWLFNNQRKIYEDGGESIIVSLMYGKNSTVKSYDGYEEIDVTPQEGITAAKYPWKQLAGSVSISRKEERQNSGKQRIINLLESKVSQLEITYKDVLDQQMFGDGTGNNSKDFFGLDLLVEDGTTGGFGTVGGIDSSVATWWQNQWQGAVGNNTFYLAAMRAQYNLASRGNEHPDIGITTRTVHENYENLLVQNAKYEMNTPDNKVGNSGFELLKFKGLVLGFDEYCPAGTMFLLNSKYLAVTIDKETDFITTPFVRPENQDAKTSQVLVMGNFVCSNRARQARLGGMT